MTKNLQLSTKSTIHLKTLTNKIDKSGWSRNKEGTNILKMKKENRVIEIMKIIRKYLGTTLSQGI